MRASSQPGFRFLTGLMVTVLFLCLGTSPVKAEMSVPEPASLSAMVHDIQTFTAKIADSLQRQSGQPTMSMRELKTLAFIAQFEKPMIADGYLPSVKQQPGYWAGRGSSTLGYELASMSEFDRGALISKVINLTKTKFKGIDLSDTQALALAILVVAGESYERANGK